jgi:hypothetical protein
MDSRGADPIGVLFADCADRVARIVYLVNGHERDAAKVVHSAFAVAGASWSRAATWPASPESWIRAHALRIAVGAGGELRRCLTPARRRPGHVALLRALGELTPPRRMALVLTHVAGLDARGVALETDATVGAAAARLAHAHADLAGHPWAADLPALLRAAAAGAEIRLLPPADARALPRRRVDHAVALAGAGLAALVLVPWAAAGSGNGPAAELASAGALIGPRVDPVAYAAAAERAREADLEKALAARQAGMRETSGRDVAWKSDKRPADFLPYVELRPDVTSPNRAGSDLGYVTAAFVHHDKVYLSVVGGEAGRERTYRVSTDAEVVPGADLRAELPKLKDRRIPLTQFLWLVQRRPTGVPMELRYNDAGRIIRIKEVGSPS